MAKKKPTSEAPVIESLSRISRASVLKHTKKDWNEWITILDRAEARSWSHQELTRFLRARHHLTPWWQQCVAIGYETHIGRRIEGQNLKGEFSVTVTKSLHVDQKTAWARLVSSEGLEAWLRPLSPVALGPKETFETEDGFFGEVRVFKKGERFRLRWQDPDWPKHSVVQLMILPRPKGRDGKGRSIFVVMHEGLANARIRESMRARWREAIDRYMAPL